MMPVIEICCLPNEGGRQLNEVHKAVVAAMCSVPGLGLSGEGDMTVLFPADMMQYGLGTEIFIRVSQLMSTSTRSDITRDHIAAALGVAISTLYPEAHVECDVAPLRNGRGFWTSRAKATRDEVQKLHDTLVAAVPALTEKAGKHCYCQANNDDHKGACEHHNTLGKYERFVASTTQTLALTTQFQERADVVMKDAKGAFDYDKKVCRVMGWECKAA